MSIQKCIEIRPNGSKRVYTINTDKDRVQTQFQEQTDVNNIVKNYIKNPNPDIFRTVGTFMDTTSIGDYQSNLQTVLNANNAFDSLPANIRARFKNDPAQFLAFMQDQNNYDEGVSLGLVDPKSQNKNANQNQTNSNKQNQNANQTQNSSHPPSDQSQTPKKTDT